MSKNYQERIAQISQTLFHQDRIEIPEKFITVKSIKKADNLLKKKLPAKLDSQFDELKTQIAAGSDYSKIWFCRIILYILQGKTELPKYIAEDWEQAADLDQACCNLLIK